MWAKNKQQGFTIVELLIVIVVIGMLATVTIVAYNGVQERARTSSRMSAIRSIQKGLEAYKTINGIYPLYSSMGAGGTPAGMTPAYGNSYEYSVATNNTWMKNLISSSVVSKPVLDPINDNTHHFIYVSYGAGLGSCQEPFYMLMALGWEGGLATMPADAQTLNCSISGTITAAWIQTSTRAVFSNLNHPTGT